MHEIGDIGYTSSIALIMNVTFLAIWVIAEGGGGELAMIVCAEMYGWVSGEAFDVWIFDGEASLNLLFLFRLKGFSFFFESFGGASHDY